MGPCEKVSQSKPYHQSILLQTHSSELISESEAGNSRTRSKSQEWKKVKPICTFKSVKLTRTTKKSEAISVLLEICKSELFSPARQDKNKKKYKYFHPDKNQTGNFWWLAHWATKPVYRNSKLMGNSWAHGQLLGNWWSIDTQCQLRVKGNQ